MKFFLILLIHTVLSSFLKNTQNIPSDKKGHITFTINEDNSLVIKVEPNSLFVIKVEGNPTTGLEWIIGNEIDLSTNYVSNLTLVEREFIPQEHEEGVVGYGGTYYFRFKSEKPTNVPISLTFLYKRFWEHDPERTVNALINISN